MLEIMYKIKRYIFTLFEYIFFNSKKKFKNDDVIAIIEIGKGDIDNYQVVKTIYLKEIDEYSTIYSADLVFCNAFIDFTEQLNQFLDDNEENIAEYDMVCSFFKWDEMQQLREKYVVHIFQ